MFYSIKDEKRILSPKLRTLPFEEYRTEWRRDYARIIHCPAFRRLQGKTQLYPGFESDFFRNRLTHSLEVAQIAKSIAVKLNYDLEKLSGDKYYIEPDIVELAALAHDLGHPPFGHLGEEILDQLMINEGGFEGNAQTLRILTKLEKREKKKELDIDNRIGLNLTYRSLASILKYDRKIPFKKSERETLLKKGAIKKIAPVKGYYSNSADLVKEIKLNVTGKKDYRGNFKTIECQIMDIADDIAYSTHDLEDSFKAGFLNPTDILFAKDKLIKKVSEKIKLSLGENLSMDDVREIIRSIFGELIPLFEIRGKIKQKDLLNISLTTAEIINYASKSLVEDGYDRVAFTSRLIGRFIRSIEIDKINKTIPALTTIKVKQDERLEIEVLKRLIFESQTASPKLKIVAYRGKNIIVTIFKALTKNKGFELLPEDFRELYLRLSKKREKNRTICDFISGMTDRYALEFYARLLSESPQTIFKPP